MKLKLLMKLGAVLNKLKTQTFSKNGHQTFEVDDLKAFEILNRAFAFNQIRDFEYFCFEFKTRVSDENEHIIFEN